MKKILEFRPEDALLKLVKFVKLALLTKHVKLVKFKNLQSM